MSPRLILALLLFTRVATAQGPSDSHEIYVAAEAADRIAVLSFGQDSVVLDREVTVGIMPLDMAYACLRTDASTTF